MGLFDFFKNKNKDNQPTSKMPDWYTADIIICKSSA